MAKYKAKESFYKMKGLKHVQSILHSWRKCDKLMRGEWVEMDIIPKELKKHLLKKGK